MRPQCANCGEREESLVAVAVPAEVEGETVDVLLCNACLESGEPEERASA